MDEAAEPPSKSVMRKSHVLLIVTLLIVIFGVIAGWYLFQRQHNQVESLTNKNATLGTQLSSLRTQISAAKAAGNVTTSGWKTYCDPHGIFCFKYPSGWAVDSSYSSVVHIGGAILTNPSKTLTVYYLDNYIKDGFAENFIVHSIKALNVGNNNLAVLGGYYVQTVEYTPQYEVVTIGDGVSSSALSDKAGNNIFAPLPAGFNYSGGVYTDTIGQFYVLPNKTFSTVQQADAWYDSIDGKTAWKIMESLSNE